MIIVTEKGMPTQLIVAKATFQHFTQTQSWGQGNGKCRILESSFVLSLQWGRQPYITLSLCNLMFLGLVFELIFWEQDTV